MMRERTKTSGRAGSVPSMGEGGARVRTHVAVLAVLAAWRPCTIPREKARLLTPPQDRQVAALREIRERKELLVVSGRSEGVLE